MFATIIGGGIVMRATSLSGSTPPAASQYRSHIAWVPGCECHGKNHWTAFVAALLRESPEVTRTCAEEFRDALRRRVIAWPLRLRIHGITSGLCSVPSLPTAAATGMPKSMCAACALPRIAIRRGWPSSSQISPRSTRFHASQNNPFACATTIGAQSVRGRIPNVSCLTSGSPAPATSSDAATTEQHRQVQTSASLREKRRSAG